MNPTEQAPIDEPLVTLQLIYPVVRFHTLEVKLTEEQAEEVEHMNLKDQAQFVIDANEEHATGEMVIDLKNMIGALDTDYATIKRI